MNLFTVFLWAIATLAAAPALLIMFWVAKSRRALRLIESTHITNPNESFHEDVTLASVPSALRALVEEHKAQTLRCGFSGLLTGRKLRLKYGRANTHYHVFVSGDLSTIAEFQHVRVGRVFPLWPVLLPFSQFIGPTVCCYTFETLFSDTTTVITGTGGSLSCLDMPSLKVNIVPDAMPFQERWESHQQEQKRWQEGANRTIVSFVSKESFFEKERIQREQIASDQALKMKQLRAASMADVWDRNRS